MKRYLVFPQDFDTRSHLLEEEKESWEEKPKQLHREGREKLLKSLEREFGSVGFEGKIQNFKDMGMAPFSMISFHNKFFSEIRKAFVIGSYYPALTAACALGERMLNHMILVLRDDFRGTPEYKKVYRKKSFDDWNLAISTLEAWGILKGNVTISFVSLKELRNKSIHFNHDTYDNVRDNSLEAIKLLSEIISLRFGFFRIEHEWAVEGTLGSQFIKKSYECDPFIEKFYLPLCPLVGPYYAVKFVELGTLFVDRANYSSNEITDEEFAEIFNNRQSYDVVDSKLPLAEDVDPVGILLHDGTYRLTEKRPLNSD